jgi:hypothetical protein
MLASFGSGITATMGDALLAVSSPDGLSAWQSVVGEFRQTVGNPLAGWPVLLGIAGFAALVWVNHPGRAGARRLVRCAPCGPRSRRPSRVRALLPRPLRW